MKWFYYFIVSVKIMMGYVLYKVYDYDLNDNCWSYNGHALPQMPLVKKYKKNVKKYGAGVEGQGLQILIYLLDVLHWYYLLLLTFNIF